MAAEYPTVDILGVEILSTGGPIHGVGSPPEGDHWSTEQLRGMADAAAELADEVKAPAKIGHKGGDPAVGWLENVRINDDGSKLLADIKRVPKGLSSLIDAGAYRTRSVELRQMTSQRTGKKHDWVVTGLAWLGGKMPAVRTLGDVVKLYEGDQDSERKFVEITWTAADVDALRDAVADLGRDLAGESRRPPDSRPMPSKYTDEQRRTFAEATGLKVEKVTDELLNKAAETLKVEPAKLDEGRELEGAEALKDELRKEFEGELKKTRDLAESATEELRLERRRSFVEDVIKAGKIKPGAGAQLEKLYDSDSDAAREFVAELNVDDDLAREYGSDEDDGDGDKPTPEEEEQRDLAERTRIAREYGMAVEEVG